MTEKKTKKTTVQKKVKENDEDLDEDEDLELDEDEELELDEDEELELDEDEELDLDEDEELDSDELIELEPEEEEDDDEEEEEDDDDENDDDSKIKSDADRHKKELEQLKERDPKFYDYLQKEGADLLDFDMSEDEDEGEDDQDEDEEEPEFDENDDDDGEEDEDEEDEEKPGKKSIKEQNDSAEVVTKAMLAEWIDQLEKTQNLKAFKKMLSAFKTAARMSDEEQQENITFVYKIVSPHVFNKVVTTTMRYAPTIFNHYLKPKKQGGAPSTAARWSFMKSLVKSYLHNLLHLLQNLTDANMHYVAIREAEKCTAYWACFEKTAKDYLKTLLSLWSNLASSDNVRIQSFLAIRSLAITPVETKKGSENFLDLCLKNIYLTFVRNCKTTNPHTLPAINLMRNLAVELYGINQVLSYQQAFAYIRQLAVHLRGAMQLKTKESYKAVYNWQYIHCIDFWANVLSTYCQPKEGEEESPLKSLVFPLVQVALGAVRLIPTAQYFPLRFHVLRCMISLNQSTRVFIPLAPFIFEVFESGDVKNKSNPSTLKPLEWEVHLKAPKQYLHTRVYQDGILEQANECLNDFYKSFYTHIAFPEMVIPGIVALETKSKFIIMQRSKADFSPADTKECNEFMAEMRQKLQ
ncbi:Noc2p family-domain-containing protein [Phycomyces nitens]|nr:Noc2p family-domain-containing protein [Phycomyces nitens]